MVIQSDNSRRARTGNLIIPLIILIFLFPAVDCLAGSGDEISDFRDQAIKAYREKDYPGFVEWCEKLVDAEPSDYLSHYYLANAYALNGNAEKAIEVIRFLLDEDYDLIYSILTDGDFENIRTHPGFLKLAESIESKKSPVINGVEAFSVPEKDLIPEGIAYDPVDRAFYLGSLHKCKIVRTGGDGSLSDFTSERQDGLLSVVGMKVDAERRHLWAASGYGYDKNPHMPEEHYGTTGVFKYDLDTGSLINKYIIPGQGRYMNDLVVGSKGDVYITDSLIGAVFVIYAEIDSLQKLVDLPRDGNGIAFNEDESMLYIGGSGIGVLDLETLEFTELDHPSSLYPCADGLYFHKGCLVSICLDMVVRHTLDKNGKRITGSKVLDAFHPDYNLPTTGVVVGDDLYYISNSQLRDYDEKGILFPLDELEDPRILKVGL